MALVFFVVLNKKSDVNNPTQSHHPRLQQNENKGIDTEPPKYPVVVVPDSNQYPPSNKSAGRNGNRQGITHISGTIPKALFHFVFLVAN
jgi:hypothetical protein